MIAPCAGHQLPAASSMQQPKLELSKTCEPEMFNDPNWQLVVQYLAYIFLMPPVAILIIDKVVRALVRDVFPFYAITGVVGTPIHELGHMLACWVFGMKITKARLYSPDKATGRLGYVEFKYRPASILHAIGLVVQGVAPIFMAFALFEFMFPAPQTAVPWSSIIAGDTVVLAGLQASWNLVFGNLCSDGVGILWGLAALIVALHCIPSWADIRLALRGGLVLLIIALAVSFLPRIDFTSPLPPSVNAALSVAGAAVTGWGFAALEWVVYAVTMVTASAVGGVLLLLVLPAVCLKLARRLRTTRNGGSESVCDSVDSELPAFESEVIVSLVAAVSLESRPAGSDSPADPAFACGVDDRCVDGPPSS